MHYLLVVLILGKLDSSMRASTLPLLLAAKLLVPPRQRKYYRTTGLWLI